MEGSAFTPDHVISIVSGLFVHLRRRYFSQPSLELLQLTLLGTLAKLRKATISFVMSVRLSEWNNSISTGGVFLKFDI